MYTRLIHLCCNKMRRYIKMLKVLSTFLFQKFEGSTFYSSKLIVLHTLGRGGSGDSFRGGSLDRIHGLIGLEDSR